LDRRKYIVTCKFNDYLPNYRLEDIFARQEFEISRATQSVWCGDVGDLAEPLYELMGNEVRASHVVATDDTIVPMLRTGHCAKARMWVYVGDSVHPYDVFDFTLSRGRDGPKYFLKDYKRVLLAGGYDGVVAGNAIVRAGCWAHLRRKVIEAERAAPEIAQEAVALMRALYAVEKQGLNASGEERLRLRQKQSGAHVGPTAREVLRLEGTVVAQASHGGGNQVRLGPMGRTQRLPRRRHRGAK
jgi:hypothetical protein